MSETNRPEIIKGYEHPARLNSERAGIYKTFTEGKKIRKNEKFQNTVLVKQYQRYSEINVENCPICNIQACWTCQCGFSDKKCENDHVWYTDRGGEIKLENPHH